MSNSAPAPNLMNIYIFTYDASMLILGKAGMTALQIMRKGRNMPHYLAPVLAEFYLNLYLITYAYMPHKGRNMSLYATPVFD